MIMSMVSMIQTPYYEDEPTEDNQYCEVCNDVTYGHVFEQAHDAPVFECDTCLATYPLWVVV